MGIEIVLGEGFVFGVYNKCVVGFVMYDFVFVVF